MAVRMRDLVGDCVVQLAHGTKRKWPVVGYSGFSPGARKKSCFEVRYVRWCAVKLTGIGWVSQSLLIHYGHHALFRQPDIPAHPPEPLRKRLCWPVPVGCP